MKIRRLFLKSNDRTRQRVMRIYTFIGLLFGLVIGAFASYKLAYPELQPVDYWGTTVIDSVPAKHQEEMHSPPEAKAGEKPKPESVMQYRKDCRISRFGHYPWLKPGTKPDAEWEARTHQALRIAGVPREKTADVIQRIKAKSFDDYLFTNNQYAVSGSGVSFLPHFWMTWRNGNKWVICENSATNFSDDGRTEQAELYKVQINDNHWLYVSVYIACGNVSVMTEAPAGWVPHESLKPRVPHPRDHGQQYAPIPGPGGLWYWPVPFSRPNEAAPTPNGPGNTVPEPSTIYLTMLGIALVIGIAIARKKR
jgi:hypothetical protein